MASPDSIWGGIIAFFTGIMISIILFISVGYASDKIVTAFENTVIGIGGMTIYDIPAPWNMGYSDTLFLMDLMYIVCASPAILGVIIMFLSAIKTQNYDVFGQEDTPIQDTQIPMDTYAPEVQYKKGGLF